MRRREHAPKRPHLPGALIVCAVAGALARAAVAGPVAAPEDDRSVVARRWSMSDGLPQSSVNAIVQAPDGALWIATFGGVARFDGSRFRIYDLASRPPLASSRVTALAVDPTGVIWCGSEDGYITSIGSESRTWSIPPDRDSTVEALAIDREGRTIVGTRSGVYVLDPASASPPRRDDRLPKVLVRSLAVDRRGAIWVAAADSVYRLTRDTVIAIPAPPGEIWDGPMVAMIAGGDEVCVASQDWIGTIVDLKVRNVVPNDLDRGSPEAILPLRVDQILVVYRLGIVGYSRSRSSDPDLHRWLTTAPASEPFQRNAACLDTYGQLWIGSLAGGLERRAMPRAQALPMPNSVDPALPDAHGVLVDQRGRLWVGVGENVVRYDDFRGAAPGVPFLIREGVRALSLEDDGSVLVVSDRTLRRITGDALAIVAEAGPEDGRLNDARVDPSGRIWLASDRGLFVEQDGGLAPVELPGNEDRRLRTLMIDPSGTVWAGARGVLYRATGPSPRAFTHDGVDPLGAVRSIVCADGGREIWAGTYGGGLVVVRDDVLHRVTRRDGLRDNVISGMLIDEPRDVFWMLGNHGAYRFHLSAMRQFAHGERGVPPFAVYGSADGMPEGSAGNPAIALFGDGTVAMTTVVGPRILGSRDGPELELPRPTIERVRVDGVEREPTSGVITLDATAQRVEIEYATVNLVAPESTQYECRLRGFEDVWHPRGSAGECAYTHLPPGEYAFDVRAALGDGRWTEMPSPLRIVRVRAWFETLAFRVTLVGVPILGVLGIALLSWRRHHQRVAALAAQIRFREEARDREKRLVDEINHRVRNNLASVIALIQLGVAAGRDGDHEFSRRVVARVRAIAQTHDLLARRRWSPVALSEVIGASVRPEQPARESALVRAGDDPRVGAVRCQPLALTFYELAANARRHGAWCDDAGTVRIDIRANGNGAIAIDWREQTDREVRPPTSMGSGLRLVRGFVEHDLGGSLVVEFEPSGLHVTIHLPAIESLESRVSSLEESRDSSLGSRD